MKLTLLLICFGVFSFVEPHGFLTKPLPRHFIHYYKPEIPAYDKDPSALFCGSFEHQYYLNDGKCGLCGDEYSQPKLFENDGLYATKTIVDYYLSGQVVNISHSVVVDGNHGGAVEIFLCPLNSSMDEATEECFAKYPLRILEHPKRSPIDEFKFLIDLGETVPYGSTAPFMDETFQVKLPDGLTCERCVLRWKWVNDQRKGKLINETELIGIGAQQEFRNCADIRIMPNPENQKPIEEYVPIKSIQKNKPVFQCETWKMPTFSLNIKPDLNKYTGSGLICWNKANDFWNDMNLIIQHFQMCDKCFRNCMTPDKICPDECICRWYE